MEYLGLVATIIVVTAITRYIWADSKKQPDMQGEGIILLRMSKAIGFIGIIGIGGSIILGIVTYLLGQGLYSSIVATLFLSLLSIPLLLISNIRVLDDEEGIEYIRFGLRTKAIKWNEIKKVKFKRIGAELVLISDTTKIKLDVRLIGFAKFYEMMKDKIDYDLYKDVKYILDRFFKKTLDSFEC